MMYPVQRPYTPYTPSPANTSHNPYVWSSAEQAAANIEPIPDARAARGFWSGRFGVMFGTVTALVTVVAIVLAVVVAPGQAAQVATTPPSGYTVVFNATPSDNDAWNSGNGCTFTSQGLDVTGGGDGAACLFRPSALSDLTSQGFWLQATIAPAADVQSTEVAVVLIGDSEPIFFDMLGAYVVDCQVGSALCETGTTTAWHTNGLIANTITISYDAGSATLTIYANGQLVTTAPMTQGAQPTLALGAGGDGDAVFTHASIYSANAGPGAGG